MQCKDGPKNRFCNIRRTVQIGVVENHGNLFAFVAGHGIAGAVNDALDGSGNSAQAIIAHSCRIIQAL